MANRFSTLARVLLAQVLLLLPLSAQLNPKLQGSKTDFLNLYQQSTTAKVKPEVLTVFDFSGSMNALMYHPLYQNNNISDSDDKYMTFELLGGANTYTITATASACSTTIATYQVVVNADGTATGIQLTKSDNQCSGKVSITYITASPMTFKAKDWINFSAKVTNTKSGGSVKANWTDGLGHTGATGGTWDPSTFSWQVPAYSTPPYVEATLNPTKATDSPAGTYLTAALTKGILIKPNGLAVTESDANGVTNGSGLTAATTTIGARDVRNWIRAASHVRFSATVDTKIRTIDIPIPWKIILPTSTQNPLENLTIKDSFDKVSTSGVVTHYGSDLDITLDQSYLNGGGSSVFSVSNQVGSGYTKCTLNSVWFHPHYVSWLFLAKYTDGSYASEGKFIVFDALDDELAGGQKGHKEWGQGFGIGAADEKTFKVPIYNVDRTYSGKESTGPASANLTPTLTRVQAVKKAAIQTWINFQADVLWAFRFLDPENEALDSNDNLRTTFNNDSASTLTTSTEGKDSGWRLLNNTASQSKTAGNSVAGMNKIASLRANTSTPLTFATARGLAQFSDPDNIFSTVETGADTPSQCMNHFLILFTDGVDNNGTGSANGNTACPYLVTSGGVTAISALKGNQAILTGSAYANFNVNQTWWNIFSFAGAAAHLGDKTLLKADGNPGTVGTDYMKLHTSATLPTGTVAPSSFLPLALFSRGSVNFEKPHLITTMTVGVSLGGTITQAGPKRSMFLAAAVGDPTMPSHNDITTIKPFQWDDNANNGNGARVGGTAYFFDAADPTSLIDSLDKAIRSAVGASNINTVANPNTPFIGAALGGELFIGKFQPPTNGGAVWSGDLMMFASKLDKDDNLVILDKTGLETKTLTADNAQWSAYKALADSANRPWYNRTLYTRLPATSSTEPSLVKFSDQSTAYDTIKGTICQGAGNTYAATYGPDTAKQKNVIQWAMGGDITALNASGYPTKARANIMGDIINSSPTVLEYKWSDVKDKLTPALAGKDGTHFRLVLVGTNQGWLHAFGEVVKQAPATNAEKSPIITQGNVDELWSFMPTDFLGYLDQLVVNGNPHRFMVDGAPTIYHLDLPPTSGGGRGNGVVDISEAPGSERAMVIIGLGKGGRSYYALDIHDPFNPKMKWSLVPDEAGITGALASRILPRDGAPSAELVQKVVSSMGFSTCTPGIGRITITDASGHPVIRDAVFFGGGLGIPEIEANFPDGALKPTAMGRSVLALDAYTGQILAAVDLSSSTVVDSNSKTLAPGSVSRGVVPFEFVLNSGMAQRAYFLDNWGGLWSWGSQATDTVSTIPASGKPNPTYQYRFDSSNLANWTATGTPSGAPGVRLVAKDISGSLISLSGYSSPQQYYSEALYSTLPAPFRVGQFRGAPKVAGGPIPAAVGIAIESGDRNNPLDRDYSKAPVHHRASVVFDRQDSLAWGSIANPIVISESSTAILNAGLGGTLTRGDAVITPGNKDYYLAPTPASGTKFGYYFNFPDIDTKTNLIPKGINTPTVVSGSLFYSYFIPTESDICTGGNGYTYSKRICDVYNPVITDTDTKLDCMSGLQFMPMGVASDFVALGTRGVVQIGTKEIPNAPTGSSKTEVATKTILGKSSQLHPKARVWRTVR